MGEINEDSIKIENVIRIWSSYNILEKYHMLRGTNLYDYLRELNLIAMGYYTLRRPKQEMIDRFIYAMDKVKIEMGLL